MCLATDVRRGAQALHRFSDPSRRQEIALELDGGECLVVRNMGTAADRRARISKCDDSWGKEVPSTGDEVRGHLDMADDTVG